MNVIRDYFAALGEHFELVVVLLIEFLVAVFLFCFYYKVKYFSFKRNTGVSARGEKRFSGMKDVEMLLRSNDKLPLYVSDNFESIFGVPLKKLYSDIQVLSDIDGKHGLFSIYDNWDGKCPLEYSFPVNGSDRWYNVNISRNAAEGTDLLIFCDITDIKNECFALEEKIKKAEGESLTKSQFLSRMSHEIRTPMNGIIGMLSLAEKQCRDDAQAVDYINKAEDLSQYLLSIINDILDLSRIEAGKLELEQKPFDLRDVAQKLDNMFRANIEAKGIKFDIVMEQFENYCVIGDETRLCRVLINFLSNAQKFTSHGVISVTFSQMLHENNKVDFMVKVHDTGIGIKPDFLDKIFLPFEQESTNITQKYGGSGLGMAITDNIVRIMGGTIVIDSLQGKGSDFTVFLSLPEADAEQAKTIEVQNDAPAEDSDFTYSGKRILLAEDNDINAEIVVDILTEEGAQVDVAKDGEEAVKMFDESGEEYYDFILMDVQMPKLNGREAAMKIRQLERSDASQICIFALSADAFLEDKRLSMEMGMDGHFPKPVDLNAMKKQIGLIMNRKRTKTKA